MTDEDFKKLVHDLGDRMLEQHEKVLRELSRLRGEITRQNRSLKRLWRRVADTDPPPDLEEKTGS